MKRMPWRIFLLVLMLLSQAACGPPGVLYLTPGRFLEPVGSVQESQRLVLEKFAESFSVDEFLGRHVIGANEQFLRVKKGLVSETIDTLLGDRFINNQVSFSRGSGWDRTLGGLQSLERREGVVLSGDISKFSVEIQTGWTRLTSSLVLSMDVDCLVGLPAEGKIVRKTVHMNEKVLTFSANQQTMEKLVDKFLAGVTEQIYKNIAEFVE